MAFEMTPQVEMREDEKGKVRRLHHPRQAYGGEAVALDAAPKKPRELAEEYLRDVRLIVDLPEEMMSAFDAPLMESETTDDDAQLRIKEEKRAIDTVAVTYAQTRMGVPVWNAGVTVRVRTEPTMEVTGMQNEVDYDIDLAPPPAGGYLPGSLDAGQLAELVGQPGADLELNHKKLVIYKYEADERLETSDDEEMGGFRAAAPVLDLPPVADTIEEGKHYLCTHALFALEVEGLGKVNWRAFIEPETGSVLYLRALVASANGCIFERDPVTQAGAGFTAASSNAELNPLRSDVELAGLPNPAAGSNLKLEGDLVRIADTQSPSVAGPEEASPFEFCYDARTRDFAAVNAYHHCDAIFRFIEGLGFDLNDYFDGTDFPVPVDHAAFNDEVNARAPSNTAGNGSGGFQFGLAQEGQTLGMATAVRITWHEFGHALLWDHVDSPNFGWAHSAGDSLAAILYDPDSQAPDRFMTFPFITASNPFIDRRHDRDVGDGWAWGGRFDNRQYGSEQILSTTHFRIYRAIGGDAADLDEQRLASRYIAFLIIKAISMQSFTTRNPEVYVDAMMDSDLSTGSFEGWPGGTVHKVIRWSFEQQGLYRDLAIPFGFNRAPGRPPAVDVYIEDGRSGEYMPYLGGPGESNDVWNRTRADDGTTHEEPVAGEANFLYVKVKNRGTGSASGVTVRVFHADDAEATWPSGFAALDPAGTAAGGDVASGGETIVGPIEWQPTGDERLLLAAVDADGDVSNLAGITAEATLPRLVPLDNNLALRTLGEEASA